MISIVRNLLDAYLVNVLYPFSCSSIGESYF